MPKKRALAEMGVTAAAAVPPGEMKKCEKQDDMRRLRELLELARSRLDVPQ
jgi:hypothetical protein